MCTCVGVHVSVYICPHQPDQTICYKATNLLQGYMATRLQAICCKATKGYKATNLLQGYKATRLQGYKAAKRLQGYKRLQKATKGYKFSTRLHGYKATSNLLQGFKRLQGYKFSTRLQGYKATSNLLQGYKRLQGYKFSTRLHGYKATSNLLQGYKAKREHLVHVHLSTGGLSGSSAMHKGVPVKRGKYGAPVCLRPDMARKCIEDSQPAGLSVVARAGPLCSCVPRG